MVGTSAFVLAALTMTGIYMRQDVEENLDNGYTVDFTELNPGAEDNLGQIANNQTDEQNPIFVQNVTDDLDYQPMPLDGEAGLSEQVDSNQIEIPGLTDGLAQAEKEGGKSEDTDAKDTEETKGAEDSLPGEEETQAASGNHLTVTQEIHFSEAQGLIRPVSGEVLLPYSMNGFIYFPTLDQYRYHPAVIYSAEEGDKVVACAKARVTNIYDDARLGGVVTLDLGDGYEAVCGQLCNFQVSVGDVVEAGQILGEVETPTKYYSKEGTNLYFQVTRNGEAINPQELMGE